MVFICKVILLKKSEEDKNKNCNVMFFSLFFIIKVINRKTVFRSRSQSENRWFQGNTLRTGRDWHPLFYSNWDY